MLLISHRGNLNGPLVERENSLEYIDEAIKLGFDVEVDLRNIDGKFWLGHDYAQYSVEVEWMMDRINNIWFHCKNFDAARLLSNLNKNFKLFCHTNEPYVCTSLNYLWVHDLNNDLDSNCIIPLISESDILNYKLYKNCYAICTDYPLLIIDEYK